MSKLTFRRDIVTKWVLLMLSAALLAHGVGYIFDDREQVVRLEGNSKWCLYTEYASMKDYKSHQAASGTSFIDIGQDKVRVFTHCEGI